MFTDFSTKGCRHEKNDLAVYVYVLFASCC